MQAALLPLLDGRLRLDEGACLPLRSAFGQCRACADVCPTGAMQVAIERLSVSDACVRCARCVAACPNEALHADGLDLDLTHHDAAAPLELECAKVPTERRTQGALEAPCLGALSAGRLAELRAGTASGRLSLIDRGWCGQCKAGCGNVHPAQAALDTLDIWLEAVGVDAAHRPALVSRPLPAAEMPAEIPRRPAVADPTPVSRRQFFHNPLDAPSHRPRPQPMGNHGRAAFPANARRASPERGRLLAALDQAAAHSGTSVPPEFFASVSNNGACIDHGVCVAACPTGSLKSTASDGTVELRFAAETCIACGACVRACPEGALLIQARGGGREVGAIARHVKRSCRDCGDSFVPRADEALCQTCTKSQRFVGDAMRQLFGSGNGPGGRVA